MNRKLHELSHHGQIVLDGEGRIVVWNQWLEQAGGISAAEAEGKTLRELFPDPLPGRLLRAVQQALISGQSSVLSSAFTPHPFPLKHPYDPNLKMTQRVVVKSFRDELDKHYCFIDITDVSLSAQREHKLKEQSKILAATLSRMNHILDGVSEAIVSTDSDGRIQTLNKAAAEMFGLDEARAVTMTLDELVPDLPEPRAGETVIVETEGSYGDPGGSLKQGDLRITVSLKKQGGSATWVINDITRAKHHERELLKAKQLAEAASRQKSDFLANMSHEIRTPMNGVLGMAELLLDTDLSHEQYDFASTIRSSGEVLLNIINDILDFSKIEAGKTDLVYQAFNLREVIEDVVALLSTKAHQKKLEIVYFVPHDIHAMVLGDPYRLRQILVNLINNAIKFTDNGHVAVYVRPGSVRAGACRYTFEVVDTGVGIGDEDHGKIFQPFAQADSSSTRRFGGTGLGLAISKRLCELMNGRIAFESTVGKGSTFRFELPLDLAGSEPRVTMRRDLGRPAVLVISDHQVNRDFIHHQLTYWHLNPVTLTPAEALRYLENETPYDLAFVDLSAGTTEGEQRLARFLAAGKRKAILLAPHSQRGRLDDHRHSHLNKPFKLTDIYSMLTKASREHAPDQADDADRLARLALNDHSPRILLVEDNAINRKVLRKMLEKLGCVTEMAVNGQEALDMLAGGRYDLVFMDCQMPLMDGYQATGAIRERERGTGLHVPIVAMTAHALRGDRDKCLAAGMDDYMSKPVKHKELSTILRKWSEPAHAGTGLPADETDAEKEGAE
ncbi:MAG: response regulator [Acidobacteriota bacterium]|nr:response regulator [Acidobacteriota bacterium]